jgi:hypothetical protein
MTDETTEDHEPPIQQPEGAGFTLLPVRQPRFRGRKGDSPGSEAPADPPSAPGGLLRRIQARVRRPPGES